MKNDDINSNNNNNNNNNNKQFFLPVILSNSPNYVTIIHSLGEVRKVSNTYTQNNPLQLNRDGSQQGIKT